MRVKKIRQLPRFKFLGDVLGDVNFYVVDTRLVLLLLLLLLLLLQQKVLHNI